MPAPPPPLPLARAIKTKILPWVESGRQLLLLPHDLEDPATLGRWLGGTSTVSHRPYKGRRVSVKGSRYIGNRSGKIALYPDDGLQSIRAAQLVCVLRGSADYRVGEKVLHCSEGSLIFSQPDVPLPDGSEPHLDPERQAHGFCDILHLTMGSSIGVACWICCSEGTRHYERPLESCMIPDAHAQAIFEALVNEAARGSETHREVCRHLVQALLHTTVREIEATHVFQFPYQRSNDTFQQGPRKPNELIPSAQSYIREHLHQPLTIDHVARTLLVSRTELTRRFRAETGQSFNEYLTQVRLEEARQLLQNSDWSVNKICESVGFKGSRLRVLFNERFGVSPLAFRQDVTSSPSAPTVRRRR